MAEWTAAGESFNPDVHSGIDIAAPAGTPVLSAWNGTVTETGFDTIKGNFVQVETGMTLGFQYCHLDSIAVEPGQQVARGTALGTVGRTGQATGDCLHLEVRLSDGSDWERLDPLEIFEIPAQ